MSRTYLNEDPKKRSSLLNDDEWEAGGKHNFFRRFSRTDKDFDDRQSKHGSSSSLNLAGLSGNLKQSMLNLCHSIQHKITEREHKSSIGSIDSSQLPPKAQKKSSKNNKDNYDTVSLSGTRNNFSNSFRKSFMNKFNLSGRDKSKKKNDEFNPTPNELVVSSSRLSISELDVREEKHEKLHVSTTNPITSPKSPITLTPVSSPTALREISYPKAVDDEKKQELTCSKQSTMQQMLNEACHHYQTLKGEYERNPTEVNQANIESQEKVIRRLKSQISQTSPNPSEGPASFTPPSASAKDVNRRSSCMENSASSLDDKEDSSSSSCGLPLHAAHQMPRSTKGSKLKGRTAYLHNSSLSRSHSDSYKQRQEYLDSLKPSASSDDFMSISENQAIGKRRQNSGLSRSNSKSQGGTSDGNSDADQLHPLAEEHSASSLDVSNSTNSIHRNSQQSITIMAFDEEDVPEEGQQESHFSKFEDIRDKPAHLAVFLHYLISNSDPAPLLFYLVTEGFNQGSGKDTKRWAYELYTTFLYEKAPLKFVVNSAGIIDSIHESLSNKSEKDDKLYSMFDHVRAISLGLVKDLFGDFRNKLSLGLGSFYGEHELKLISSHASEISLIEKYLWRQFITLSSEDNERSSATCSALLTYFRSIGLPQASNYVDRFPPFVVCKEKAKFSVFSKSNKKSTTQSADHSLQQHQYTTITACNNCQGIIGGVGFQGYVCLKCDHNFHKSCITDIRERCSSKRVDRSKTTPSILRKKIGVKAGAAASKQNDFDQVDFSLPRATSLMSLRDIKPHRIFREKERDQLKDSSILPSSKLARDDSLKSALDQTSLATTATRQPADALRSGSPEPDDESKEFYETVSKFFNNSQLEISSDSDFETETDVPQLESYVSKDVLKKLKPKEKKRQNIINELFHTERTHVRNMKVMYNMLFLKMNNEFPKDFVTLLFPNLDELIKVHDDLNKEFKAKKKESDNFVVENFADILVRHFTGEKSEQFKRVCSTFCEKQSHALETLKAKQKKDQKLSSFLQETANHPLCRRFELKDLLPTAMQRLTKYPLFISSLLKYTQTDSDEYLMLELALKGSKDILESVDKAVRDYENFLKLKDMQRRLDKRAIDNATNSALLEHRSLDLTQHKLVFDGPLTWRINKDRLIHLHVVLLQDLLLLLQKQDDRLVLKSQSMYIAAGKIDTRLTHSPIIKLVNLLIKPVATDPSAFFIVSQLTEFPQIYDLIASSKEEKDKWCRRITTALEDYKKLNPDAWKASQSSAKPRTHHHRTSAPTSPITDEASSTPVFHDNSTIHESEEESRNEAGSQSMRNFENPQYSFESQISTITMTDHPQNDDDDNKEFNVANEDEDVIDDDEENDVDDDDDDDELSLVKLRRMNEKIEKLMKDKRSLIESINSLKELDEHHNIIEAPQRTPTTTSDFIQSLLSELDETLRLCSEEGDLEYSSRDSPIGRNASNVEQPELAEVNSSQSLVVLPSQTEDTENQAVQSDTISSRSDFELLSNMPVERDNLQQTSKEPNLPQKTFREHAEYFQEDAKEEKTSEDESLGIINKNKLFTTCLTLQTDLLNLLESMSRDLAENRSTSDETINDVGDATRIEETEHISGSEVIDPYLMEEGTKVEKSERSDEPCNQDDDSSQNIEVSEHGEECS